jgi:membrane protein implicated in regulation of membrane protease activity
MLQIALWCVAVVAVLWLLWRWVDGMSRDEDPGPLRRQRRMIGWVLLVLRYAARWLIPWQ